MKREIIAGVIAILLLATTATALTLEGNCDIRFFGQSTLHDFDGHVSCQPFTLTSTGRTGIMRQPVVKILVAEMTTDNSNRDQRMFAMFEQESYPQIQGVFDDLDANVVLQQLQETETAPGPLEFDLRIRKVKKRVQAVTRDLVVSPEEISFVMEFPLSLASFQLEAPRVLGFIRVGDQVRVEARVFLRRQ
jgi:hypothetical protein